MERKQPLVCILLIVGLLAFTLMPSPARGVPIITELRHSPKYPHVGDNVNITAHIEDSTAMTSVMLFYCAIPAGTCKFYNMDGPDANNVYNKTVEPDYPNSYGADYYIMATNTTGGSATSETHYIQYALSINATIVSDRDDAYPGQHFNLTVGAHYWSNLSAAVENSSVTIRRIGSSEQWIGMTNATGNMTVEVAAPSAVGNYVYNVTITNRTLSGYAQTSLLVLVQPMPDLIVTPEDIVYTPAAPYEGDNVTANITIKNVGTEVETFYVLVVLRAGGTNTTLRNLSVTLQPRDVVGNTTVVKVWWSARLGAQVLNVTLDPGDPNEEVSEDNNFAQVTIIGLARPASQGYGALWLYAVVGIVIVVFIAGLMVSLVRRKPRPPEPEE